MIHTIAYLDPYPLTPSYMEARSGSVVRILPAGGKIIMNLEEGCIPACPKTIESATNKPLVLIPSNRSITISYMQGSFIFNNSFLQVALKRRFITLVESKSKKIHSLSCIPFFTHVGYDSMFVCWIHGSENIHVPKATDLAQSLQAPTYFGSGHGSFAPE